MASWSTACLDWRERIVARKSLVPIGPLFPSEAEYALSVFKSLPVTDQPRKADGTFPTLGDLCEPWVFDFVGVIFGAYNHETARRHIRDFLLLISKKNGKSTIAAGIMITALVINWRESAELLILAPTLQVAQNSFVPAKGMAENHPELAKLLKVADHKRTITHGVTGATLKVVAAANDVVSGSKASFVLVDELWLFGKREHADGMLREATGGLISRPEGFVIYLTTHSDEQPAGVFKDKLEYFRDVRDGVIEDPSSLGVLYEWPEEMLEKQAYLKPENWYITNPNMGKSVDREIIEGEIRKAQRGEGSTLQIVYAKHLNVEIGLRMRRDRWKGANWWEKRGDKSIASLEAFMAACDVIVAGVDGGGHDDLYGLALIGRCKITRDWLLWTRGWVHAMALDLRPQIASVLRDFAKDGDLVIWGDDQDGVSSGDQDVEDIADILAKVRDAGLMPEKFAIGVDAAGLGTLFDALKQREFSEEQIASVGSGWRLTGVIHHVERKLRSNIFTHGASAFMAWCVGNAKAETKGNAIMITKQAAGRCKIDPVIAMLNAAKMMERSPEPAGNGPVSPWDDPNFSLMARSAA
jgi:phage terminase large subunit-like protein